MWWFVALTKSKRCIRGEVDVINLARRNK